MKSGDVIPLLPLHTVLFPHTMLPLHIFEERYLAMVNRCLERGEPFGVVLIRSGEEVGGFAEPYEIGTTARITNLQHLEDGRMYLLTVGEERFHILQLLSDTAPYLEAVVEPWHESRWAQDDSSQQLVQDTEDAFHRYLHTLLEAYDIEVRQINLPPDPLLLSFAVAATLQTTLAFKQYLLELQDTGERLRLLLKVLEEYEHLPHTGTFNPDNWRAYLSRN